MRTISPKLILIIIVSILIISLLGIWIKGTFFKKLSQIPMSAVPMSAVPMSERERLIKMTSFIHNSKEEISQFVMGLYDENQGGFKIKRDSPVSLEATYYSIEALRNLVRDLNVIPNPEILLDKIRSYYVSSAGYYLEEGKEPVFSTGQALRIDRWLRENLNQEIDLDWLKSNSIENKNLEPEKFGPEYQSAVVEIYRHLPIPKEERFEKLEEISHSYFDYYGNFKVSEGISDSDYLKTKYYQISLISDLSGVDKAAGLAGSYLKEEDIEADKERLSQIQLEDLDDLKEIYWLYYLQQFYNLERDINKILEKVGKFYLKEGFKEKLTDEEPNLIGTYYGILFTK